VNKSSRFKAIFYALALLVFGGIIGAMIESALSSGQSLRLGREDEIVKTIHDRLDAKLHLTSEQDARIEPVIKKAAEEMEASHFDSLKRVNRALDNLHEQIKPELTKEQQAKMIELEQERAARMWQKYRYRQTVTNAVQH
jgi:hypothetical protein